MLAIVIHYLAPWGLELLSALHNLFAFSVFALGERRETGRVLFPLVARGGFISLTKGALFLATTGGLEVSRATTFDVLLILLLTFSKLEALSP